jgi:hypothetical protein
MKLRVFQADKGDCLLLTGDDGTNVLVDGGMKESFTRHAAPTLEALGKEGGELDVVYVSHIDRDHVYGLLQLMEDLVAWRIHDFQRDSGNEEYPEPDCRRPPPVKEVWHNAFRELVRDNDGEIEEMLATTAYVLEGSEDSEIRETALVQRELASSVGDGIELSRRIGPDQLKVPLNKAFGGKLGLRRTGDRAIRRGSLRFTVLGPTVADLSALRAEWNAWLEKNKAELARIHARIRADADRLGTTEVDALRNGIEIQATELGLRSEVTAPNLASLMFLVEEGEKTVLLTGDGHQDDILKGLEAKGKLDGGGQLHVDVLKVQHHGSENNLDADFCKRVTADHYVFCANGEHANPDLRVLDLIFNARLGSGSARATNPAAEGKFRLWFNSSSDVTEGDREHMEKVESRVSDRARGSGGRITYFFLRRGSKFELAV